MTEAPALLLIDIQHDFLPGGALAVAGGNEILEPILKIAPLFKIRIATQDWHSPHHKSFASSHAGQAPYSRMIWMGREETLWPDHCIQHSFGAEIHPEIRSLGLTRIIQKGTNPEVDSYSAFFDNHRLQKTDLHRQLQELGVTHLVVAGLATDYCVRFSVADALELGYRVSVFEPGIRGVNLEAGDSQRAIAEMKKAGAEILKGIE